MFQGFFNNNTHIKASFIQLKQQIISYVQQTIIPCFQHAKQSMETMMQHSKTFCKQHKSIILILSTITVTYILVKKTRKPLQLQKKKKNAATKSQISNKSFISDDEDVIKQQQSTQQRKQGQNAPYIPSKNNKASKNKPQNMQQCQQQQLTEDKIFFQLYKAYQNEMI